MGGFGSGQRWSKKARVEGCTALDTTDLKRMKLLVPNTADRRGSLEWRRGGAEKPLAVVDYRLTVNATAGALRLLYQMTQSNESLDYSVPLVTTPCRLGGCRWWFRCPLTKNGTYCGRRVKKLYLRGRYFGCRNCHELTYTSTQESDSRVYALARDGVGALPSIGGASVAQLGLTLKALTLIEKRAKRFGV